MRIRKLECNVGEQLEYLVERNGRLKKFTAAQLMEEYQLEFAEYLRIK